VTEEKEMRRGGGGIGLLFLTKRALDLQRGDKFTGRIYH